MSSSQKRNEPNTRDWVTCPVCGETDMRREVDPEGHALIFCVNHNCVSNGGDNMNGIELPPAPIPQGQELVPTAFVETVGLLVTISDGIVQADREVVEADATLKGLSPSAYFLHLGTRNEAAETRSAFLRKLDKATSILRMVLARRAASLIDKAS